MHTCQLSQQAPLQSSLNAVPVQSCPSAHEGQLRAAKCVAPSFPRGPFGGRVIQADRAAAATARGRRGAACGAAGPGGPRAGSDRGHRWALTGDTATQPLNSLYSGNWGTDGAVTWRWKNLQSSEATGYKHNWLPTHIPAFFLPQTEQQKAPLKDMFRLIWNIFLLLITTLISVLTPLSGLFYNCGKHIQILFKVFSIFSVILLKPT